MSIKLYYDLMSQPSRALFILLKYSNCKFESKLINLQNGEQYSEEFSAVNKLQKVPVISHNGFILTESVAIMKYLARENIIAEKLYPKDSRQQAQVDEFLEWQHIGLRLHCASYFWMKYVIPKMTGKPIEAKTLAKYEKNMESALDNLAKHWLNNGSEFISGNHITVADLLAACEIEQPRMAGYEPSEKYEVISSWLKKVRQHFNPYYDEGHAIVEKIVKKQSQPSAKL